MKRTEGLWASFRAGDAEYYLALLYRGEGVARGYEYPVRLPG